MANVSALGARVREERLRCGLSLRALARQVGVSASMVSQIETGKSQPSVGTLYAITTALGVAVEELFTSQVETDLPVAASGGWARSSAGVDGSGASGAQLGPCVRPADRPALTLDSGVTWQRLGHLPGQDTDFLLVTYPPGAASSSSGLMRHAGCEYGLLTHGALVLTLAFEEFRLEAGDSVCFESSKPHRYRNDGDEPAVGIWFVAPQR